MEAISKTKRSFRDNYFLKAFFLGLGLSFLVFVPFIIIDEGYFLFYGDFNVQQVPFYQLAHKAVKSGSFGWNQYTDLGANFIGSYSFYLLGSPFFWLTVPFPESAVPHLMGPLLILKFACASLTGYVYLHRYVKNQNVAVIGAVLYAFSGFSIYNVFFNHFHEAIVFFPLMLAALDEYMYKRRRGIFAITVAFCCIVNYYFFVGQVTFTLIYFFLRLLCKSWRISLKDFLLLGLEAVVGFAISGILMVPSVLSVLQNDRASNTINGWNSILYNKNQRYLHIIQSFFFPPDLPARPNFTPDSGSKWASLGAWLPVFGMTGVIGWLQIRRKHWLKKMLWLLFLMAMVPVLNSSFQLLNASYYARWYYMLTLMLSLATIMALEYTPVNWKRSITWTLAITVAISAIVAFTPTITETDGEETISFGLMEYPTRFWSYVAISLISIALVVFLFQFYGRKKKRFYKVTLTTVSIVAVIYSAFFIALGKTQSLDPQEHIIPYALNGGEDITLTDARDDNVRVDFYESLDNMGMYWGMKSINAFHSIVPGSIMDFHQSIGVTRDVASRPETDHYALRGLTSVKYLFDDDHDSEYFAGEDGDEPEMPGWLYYGDENGFHIWENQYYISMGFTYDYYILRSEYDALSETNRELVMLKALVVDDDMEDTIRETLMPLPVDQKIYTEAEYFKDCEKRAQNTCTSFAYSSKGFTAEINTKSNEIVFFSVPYEPGWSAKINGENAEIIQANVGFMAVQVPIGEKVMIEFTYSTPGLRSGILLTVAGIIVLLAYLQMTKKSGKRKNGSKEKLSKPKNGEKRLIARSFKKYYAKNKHATFSSMLPLEFRLPETNDPPQIDIDKLLSDIEEEEKAKREKDKFGSE